MFIKTLKVALAPTKAQESLFYQCAGTARFAYNWALSEQLNYHQATNGCLNDRELRKRFTKLKQQQWSWLYNYDNDITKQAIKDCWQAFLNFFKQRTQFPKFKSKKRSRPSFHHDSCRLKVTPTHVTLTKIGKVRLKEKGRIPSGVKYYNPRIVCDHGQWYLTVGVEWEPTQGDQYGDPIGVDLGVKYLAVVSNGVKVKNINKSRRVRQLEKRRRRLQRRASRYYRKMQEVGTKQKSKNLLSLEADLRELYRKLTNIRLNHVHQTTAMLVKTKPAFIAIEDLNVRGMLKNHHLAKAVQENMLGEVRRQLEYKCQWYGVKLVLVDRFYPSSKLCSNCGHQKSELKLSERTYHCVACGLTMDRDLNAAVNLLHYGLRVQSPQRRHVVSV